VATIDLTATERRTVADELQRLTRDQLATPSLCTEWTVHDIGAHLLMPLTVSTWSFALAMAKSLGNFDKANVALTGKVAERPTADICSELRAQAEHPFTPPGFGLEAPLTDLLVHGEDFRRPLGIPHRFDPEALRIGLDFVTSKKAQRTFAANGRLEEIRLDAVDLGWSFGSGARVEGDAIDVILAVCGRAVALNRLAGDGVRALRGG